MRLRIVRVVTEEGIEWTFWFLIRSDGTEARIPPVLESPIIPTHEEKRLPA